jgi:CRP/FNR family transcriptional regulator, cyclic AMP receptor protein
MAIPDLLKGCPLFYELYDKEIEKIVQYCNVISFEPQEVVVTDGKEGNEIYIVLDGSVKVQKKLEHETLTIQNLGPGDVFGEMVLVSEKTRSADIIANTQCSVLEIGYNDIFNIFKKEPAIFGLIILNLSRLLAKRLKNSNEMILMLQEMPIINKDSA